MKHIRIISPSGVIDSSFIEGASARLRAWGYKVSEGVHARDAWGRFAGRDEDRLSDIIEALNDASVDFILCSRGGYGLQRIIDRIAPIGKPIIGFSDITALHQLSAYHDQFSIRAGYHHESANKGNRKYFTLGAGFRMSVFSLDAGYVIATAKSNPLDQTLRFSLTFDMDGIKDLFHRK